MIKHPTAGIQGLTNVPAAAQGDPGMAIEQTQIPFSSLPHKSPLCPLKGRIALCCSKPCVKGFGL